MNDNHDCYHDAMLSQADDDEQNPHKVSHVLGLDLTRNCAGKSEEWVCATCTVVQNTCQLFDEAWCDTEPPFLVSAHAQHAILLIRIVTTA